MDLNGEGQIVGDVHPDPTELTAFERMQDAIHLGEETQPAALLVIYPEAYDGSHRDLIWTTAFRDDAEGREKARDTARNLRGVVACVPIVYDFRETQR